MLPNGSRVGGKAFHVRDSLVWAEIYYLESATDYREYLPQPASVPKVDSELVMLDSCPKHPTSGDTLSAVWALFVGIIAIGFLLLVYFSF